MSATQVYIKQYGASSCGDHTSMLKASIMIFMPFMGYTNGVRVDPVMACQQEGAATTYPFCDPTRPIAARVADLVARVHDEDKPKLLTARAIQSLPYLNVPGYYWGTNCISSVENGAHGEINISRCVEGRCATKFPNPPNWMSSFNRSAMQEMARVLAAELRGLYNVGAARGLDCWGPVLNLARDPRWGRNGEAGSEDPYLMSQYSSTFTDGFQTNPVPASSFLAGVATLKHWDANTLESSDGFTRHTFDANVSAWVLQDSYFPAFRAAVIKGARGVMCAYNSVRGVPSCSSKLLRNALEIWNFTGYTTSDSDAVKDSYAAHHYWPNGDVASCRSITDGKCDINSGGTYGKYLLSGVQNGSCTMSDINEALERTFKIRFELGLFDPRAAQPLCRVGIEAVASPSAKELNLQAAEEGLVLLLNEGGALPLSTGQKIVVVGPLAADPTPMLGTHYKGYACSDGSVSCVVSPLQAISALNNASGGTTTYVQGCKVDTRASSPNDIAAAVAAAKTADTVVAIMGITNHIEHESHDRDSIDLPSAQQDLMEAVLALGKRTILILLNGGAVSIDKELAAAPSEFAVVEALLPGARGGEALANGIFGRHAFGGRLPYTIYPASFVNTTHMSVMDPRIPPGRTYRFHKGPVLFPFAAGLSLASVRSFLFHESGAHTISTDDGISWFAVQLDVPKSSMAASQVVTAFWEPPATLHPEQIPAMRQLFDFDRVAIKPGGTALINFTVTSRQFMVADVITGDLVVLPGVYTLHFTDGTSNSVTTELTLTGTKRTIESFPDAD